MGKLLIGAAVMAAFMIVVAKINKSKLQVPIWKWLFMILGFIYFVFVLLVIEEFLVEPKPQAALVIGGPLAVIAVIWGVVISRLVFGSAKPAFSDQSITVSEGGKDDVQSVDA